MNPDNNMAMLKRPVNPSFGWTRSDARHPHKVSYRRRTVTVVMVGRMVMALMEMVKAMVIAASTLTVAVRMKLMLRTRSMMISLSR